MKKTSTVYTCSQCEYTSPKWLGRCPDCGAWNSLEEGVKLKKETRKRLSQKEEGREAQRVHEISADIIRERIVTGIHEFDRVLGGGIFTGSLTLIGGEPGIGKSTLLTEVLGRLSRKYPDHSILYVSGEESKYQVASRAKRLNVAEENFYIYNETSWQKIQETIQKIGPQILVIDSIQTTTSEELNSPPGTVSQIREVTYEIMNNVKTKDISCFIVGHITKDGNIAGPKILEHMVDTVIYFEGDQYGHYRILRAIKNRFGNTNEVGIFEMGEEGLKEVSNPGQFFLEDQLVDSFGRSLSCVMEGTRPLFVETQALVVENKFGTGRRTTQGVDSNRVAMLVAIIEKYFDIPIGLNDIYVNIAGGIKVNSREVDLSIIASLLGSYFMKPIDQDTVFLGEVGLTGEVRSIPKIEARIKEMDQLNYKRVITSKKIAQEIEGKFKIQVEGIKEARELLELLKFNQSREEFASPSGKVESFNHLSP